MSAKGERTRIIEKAERFVRSGRIPEAIAEYQKLLEDEYPEPSILNIVGDLYLRLGDKQKAVNYFRQAAESFESRGGSSQALAIVKKITKVFPDDPEFLIKTGDLLRSQGFYREAEKEYLKAIEILRHQKRLQEIIPIYEKLVILNRENIDYRTQLADLYASEGKRPEALNQFNDIAELLISRNELERAQIMLLRAYEIEPLDERTVGNLLQVLKKKGEIDKAFNLVKKIADKSPGNLTFRYWLGSLHMDKNEIEEAQKIFESILAERPTEVRARVQLGKVFVLQGQVDRAFELYEPLINSLLKKKKEEKAIGLLGIILSGPSLYLPALEKLAAIYKTRNERNNLEVVLRAIVEEAKRQKMKDKMYAALAELVELVPYDEDVLKQYWSLRKELELEGEAGESTAEVDEEYEELLARADIYIHQGLYRNARRVLENLSLQRPNDSRIRERLELIDQAKVEIPEEELILRVEKISVIESEIEKRPGGARSFLSFLRETGALDEKVTSAEIFHGTDILPLNITPRIERRFYDLEEKAKEEIETIKMAVIKQLQKGQGAGEKELAEIIQEFKRQAKVKLGLEDYETHFQLGLAFLEQGLFDEAIEELMLSAQSPEKALESCTLIAEAFKRKKDYREAIHWLEKCLELCFDDPEKLHSLEYEIASLYEKLQDRPKALSFYNKILKWNSSFRDVAKRVAALQRAG